MLIETQKDIVLIYPTHVHADESSTKTLYLSFTFTKPSLLKASFMKASYMNESFKESKL